MNGFRMERLATLMEPEPGNPLEVEGTLNPAVARGPDGTLYLFPRIVARGNYSRIGMARVLFNDAGDPYAGDLPTLRTGGLTWSQRFCSLGASGSLVFIPSGDVYFVVAGNNGTTEGSYGRATAGERPAAGSGAACSYLQDLSGTCP